VCSSIFVVTREIHFKSCLPVSCERIVKIFAVSLLVT